MSDVGIECRARHAALRYVTVTKNIFRAYHTSTALTKMAAAIVDEDVEDGFDDLDYLSGAWQ